jgi:molybdenum ABC transporter molybdate-binding protein
MLYAMGRTAPSPLSSDAASRNLAGTDQTALMLYCAAGMRAPIENIVAAYEAECGVRVSTQFGGSNTLLSQIEIGRTGDLFLAADNSYTEAAQRKGLVQETLPIASIRPVIAIPAGNPKQIASIDDLLRADVRVAIGNPDQAASGKLVREALSATGHWQPLEAAIIARGVFQPTVSEAANAVKVGAADAAIVWDVTVAPDPQFRAIAPPEFADIAAQVAIGVLADSRQSSAALQFARYATASDRGLKAFALAGFQVVAGSRWDASPAPDRSHQDPTPAGHPSSEETSRE